MPKYVSPMNLSDEHMRLVGIIAAHWEAIDVLLQRAIAEVMELPLNRIALLTDNLGFGDKINILMIQARRAFQEENNKENWAEFTSAVKSLRDANILRNTYVHSWWFPSESSDPPIHAVIDIRGGKLITGDRPTPTSELENAASEIYQAGQTFLELFQKYGLLQS